MTTDLILYGDTSVPAPLTTARAGAAANRAAASHVFSAYQQRRPANTLRRQCADLDLFARFLRAVGADPAGQLAGRHRRRGVVEDREVRIEGLRLGDQLGQRKASARLEEG